MDALRRDCASIESVARQKSVSLIVLGEENVSNSTALAAKVARDASIPSLIVPWGYPSSGDFVTALSAITLYHGGSPAARKFCDRYPHWRIEHDPPLLRLPLEDAAAMEFLGMAPPRPWLHNDGFSNALAVESERMKKHYVNEGVPRKKLRETGAWSDDLIAAGLADFTRRRHKLCTELGLDPDRPIVLCALPSDMTASRLGHSEFESYDAILTFWIDSLAALEDVNVVLCAHPSTTVAGLPVHGGQSIRTSSRPTVDLLPLSDLFVACVSSVIRWALACGIPVIDYDVYGFRYENYSSEPLVHRVASREEFTATLKREAGRSTVGAHVPRPGEHRRGPWGCLDGRSLDRILGVFDELTGSPTRPRRRLAVLTENLRTRRGREGRI
jgi:hypothetical protein